MSKKQLLLVFLSFWLHISLLDLIFVNFRGPVFLWRDNVQLATIATHFSIAVLATMVIMGASVLVDRVKQQQWRVSDKVWLFCSIILVLSIGLVIY